LRVEEAELQNLGVLLERLPTEETKSIQVGISGLRIQQRVVAQGINIAEIAIISAHDKAHVKEIHGLLTSLRQTASTEQSQLWQIENMTEIAVAKYYESLNRKYDFYAWLSYFLYTLGWGPGLVGRLVGVNAGGED